MAAMSIAFYPSRRSCERRQLVPRRSVLSGAGLSVAPWGHENIPCAYSNSINQVTYYNSNDPRFVLGCGAAATMVLEARYD
jgi:hypothetical protein